MMKIEFDDVVLRDMTESDIEDYVRWFTVEREWENWDAPWENEDTCEEAERKRWTEYYGSVKDRPDDAHRWKFEIEWNGRHIGWVRSYCIDENYEWVEMSGVNELYTQTWSGNVRMLRCAEKLGFVECNRGVGTREADGQRYDGLTFRIQK